MPKSFHKCPACSSELIETSLYCQTCNTEIKGEFTRSKLAMLNEEQEEFVLKFLSTRGSLKEMERILGVSYPTVRARLDEILKSLDIMPLTSEDAEVLDRRRAILDDLDSGRLSAEKAADLLRKLKAGDKLE
ncbi:MAG: DUF2089 domain-containing protein [Firmicutes bacterium]|nr:DUF2089 domain-containing protein [Bacillota bacterium]MDD4263637.1 DUF2089 domain-containing protein [Bacillota bacterium]MDD4693869.1 DUF2089 domain-containing protein [Bacillota bacterium]